MGTAFTFSHLSFHTFKVLILTPYKLFNLAATQWKGSLVVKVACFYGIPVSQTDLKRAGDQAVLVSVPRQQHERLGIVRDTRARGWRRGDDSHPRLPEPEALVLGE